MVKAIYGWGWYRLDGEPDSPSTPVKVPDPFRCRIQRFFTWQGELRGFLGTVEERDRLWAILWTRTAGVFDFLENLLLQRRDRPGFAE